MKHRNCFGQGKLSYWFLWRSAKPKIHILTLRYKNNLTSDDFCNYGIGSKKCWHSRLFTVLTLSSLRTRCCEVFSLSTALCLRLFKNGISVLRLGDIRVVNLHTNSVKVVVRYYIVLSILFTLVLFTAEKIDIVELKIGLILNNLIYRNYGRWYMMIILSRIMTLSHQSPSPVDSH